MPNTFPVNAKTSLATSSPLVAASNTAFEFNSPFGISRNKLGRSVFSRISIADCATPVAEA